MKTDRFFTVFLDQERKIIRMGEQYGADQIQILEGLEAVRKRPGMYIGSTSSRGLHHLVYEIVDNSVDEALAGYCDSIEVTINPDNSITVVDDGRGIPVDIQKKAGLPAVEVVFTILHAGGKFGNGGYKVSGGLHGVGASVVNALSEWLEVQVLHNGNVYQQRYERGKVMYPLKIVGKCGPNEHGTRVTFLPDKEIFEETVYDFDTLKIRLQETAFLTKNLKITLRDEREEKQERTFHYEGGIREFVTYLNKGKTPLYDQVIYCEGKREGVYVEVSMQHNDSYTENVYTFVNNINTPEGGTHLTGFKNALTKTFNDYARKNKLLKENEESLSGEDIREGLTAAGLSCFGGVNAPYIWIKTPDGMGSWDFFDLLLDRANVATTPGAGFGPSGEGYIRLTAFGGAEATREAVERVKAAL